MMYQKLVRDNIPAIIEANGETCVTRKLSEKEYENALAEKLKEEVAELLEAYTAKERSALDCAEEMADVMEVLYAMGKTCAVSKREVEQVRSQKAAEKQGKKLFKFFHGNLRRMFMEAVCIGCPVCPDGELYISKV